MAPKLIGQTIAGKYLVLQHIGGGAMGDVYLAEHTGLGRQFAVKVLKQDLVSDPVLAERFRREAHATSRLEHVNIVYISDFGTLATGQPFLVMEYITGHTLAQELSFAAPDVLPLSRVQSILEQLFDAAGLAHGARVIHRDLKTENVLLSETDDGSDLIKILDFGMAKMIGEEGQMQLTRAGEALGTPTYMPPEQATGQPIDHRSDLYSLGIISYELLAGRPPFVCSSLPGLIMAHLQDTPEPPSMVRPRTAPQIPELLESIVLACLAKSPDDRPQQAWDVLDVLRRTRPLTVPSSPVAVEVSLGAADDAKDGDWGEVTVEATFTGIPSKVLEHDALLAEAGIGAPAKKAWTWEDAAERALHLARQLEAVFRAPPALVALTRRIEGLEEDVQSAEIDLTAAVSRREEIEHAVRDHEARLRHAIADLSYERGRLAAAPATTPAHLRDLDFQISELESRLRELYGEQHRKLDDLGRIIAGRQARAQDKRQALIAQQAELLNQLHRHRPEPCPAPIQATYEQVAEILRALR